MYVQDFRNKQQTYIFKNFSKYCRNDNQKQKNKKTVGNLQGVHDNTTAPPEATTQLTPL